ncbi:MAG: hypothetical protein B7Z37_04195 [Verrucomicrobia bacterium 12-59-8]|nr:MAG: hypothetical protein B7Z37_04195 [Verrucomicrobia bacterium 12-59-8]
MKTKRVAVLDIVRVVGMIFVMFIHSPIKEELKGSPEVFLLHSFFASGAVPIFFLLSGYLGAKRIRSDQFSWFAYAKDKLNSLIIPFLFWNVLVILLVFVAKATGLSTVFQGNGSYFDLQFSVSSIATALFGIGRAPIVYQFWFLRDLIIVSFLAVIVCRRLPNIPLHLLPLRASVRKSSTA